MKQRFPTIGIPLIFVLGALLSGCYGFDPIKDKQNKLKEELNNGGSETSPTPPEGQSVFDVRFSFEKWSDTTPALPLGEGGFSSSFWASASNEGFKAMPNPTLPYPVTLADEGYQGRCVRMLTRPGIKVYGMGSYLVAASLFSGKVDVSKLISAPLEATYFGHRVRQRPIRLRGYYRYKAGSKYIDGSIGPDAVLEGKDQCTIAGVFYEVTEDTPYLNGKNLYTAPSIVSIAKVIANDTDGWQPFDLTFRSVGNKVVDLANKQYRLALVFSSSSRGDEYIGSVDSELLVDEVTLTLTTLPE